MAHFVALQCDEERSPEALRLRRLAGVARYPAALLAYYRLNQWAGVHAPSGVLPEDPDVLADISGWSSAGGIGETQLDDVEELKRLLRGCGYLMLDARGLALAKWCDQQHPQVTNPKGVKKTFSDMGKASQAKQRAAKSSNHQDAGAPRSRKPAPQVHQVEDETREFEFDSDAGTRGRGDAEIEGELPQPPHPAHEYMRRPSPQQERATDPNQRAFNGRSTGVEPERETRPERPEREKPQGPAGGGGLQPDSIGLVLVAEGEWRTLARKIYEVWGGNREQADELVKAWRSKHAAKLQGGFAGDEMVLNLLAYAARARRKRADDYVAFVLGCKYPATDAELAEAGGVWRA